MPAKVTDSVPELREVTEYEDGFTWIAHPDEGMQRASHALASDGEVWVVDPVDAGDLDDRLAEYGSVAGVVTLLDRHKRDAAVVARRHDVSVHVPHWMGDIAEDLNAPVESLTGTVGDTDLVVHELINNSFWKEGVLFREDDGVLVVPEAVGTAGFFRAGSEPLGVQPVLRMTPPRKLGRLTPQRILVGHGPPVTADAAVALSTALRNSRRRAPAAYAKALSSVVFG